MNTIKSRRDEACYYNDLYRDKWSMSLIREYADDDYCIAIGQANKYGEISVPVASIVNYRYDLELCVAGAEAINALRGLFPPKAIKKPSDDWALFNYKMYQLFLDHLGSVVPEDAYRFFDRLIEEGRRRGWTEKATEIRTVLGLT